VTVQDTITELILRDHLDWSPDAYICRSDLSRYSANYVESLIESERGELSSLEQEVVDSLRQHELLAINVDVESEKMWSFGEKLSDRMANFGGSWAFLVGFSIFIAAWIVTNSMVLYLRPIDPFPYILLNLLLSCLAAIQAPIIAIQAFDQP